MIFPSSGSCASLMHTSFFISSASVFQKLVSPLRVLWKEAVPAAIMVRQTGRPSLSAGGEPSAPSARSPQKQNLMHSAGPPSTHSISLNPRSHPPGMHSHLTHEGAAEAETGAGVSRGQAGDPHACGPAPRPECHSSALRSSAVLSHVDRDASTHNAFIL